MEPSRMEPSRSESSRSDPLRMEPSVSANVVLPRESLLPTAQAADSTGCSVDHCTALDIVSGSLEPPSRTSPPPCFSPGPVSGSKTFCCRPAYACRRASAQQWPTRSGRADAGVDVGVDPGECVGAGAGVSCGCSLAPIAPFAPSVPHRVHVRSLLTCSPGPSPAVV